MRPACLVLLLVSAVHAEEAKLNPHLQPLAPMLGKTFKSTFKGSADKPGPTDISRWESVLNGQAVRILHSINDGIYGGESLIHWDEEKGTLISHYATTAGFYTTGTARVEEGRIVTEEQVHGNAGGISAVRAVTEVLPDGSFKVTVRHLSGEKWEEAGERLYRVAPDAQVVFKDSR